MEKIEDGKRRAELHNRSIKRESSFFENVTILQDFLDFCSKREINVLFVITPVTSYYLDYLDPDVKSEFCLGDAGCSKTVARTGIAASLVWGGVHYWRHCDPREYGVMGLMWGLFSVIIASAAQLSLGFAASHLPPMTHLWDFIAALLAFGLDARILLLGLLGYLLSVFCWYKTLHKLALSKAYALLSMSYVLVWIASMVLPGWEGTFSLKALLGVACIMSGLMLIFLPMTKQRY